MSDQSAVEREYRLYYRRRPWSINAERRGMWVTRAPLMADWRAHFADQVLKLEIPPLDAVHIYAIPILKNRRSMPDVGACMGAVKSAIDGVKDAGVLVDDSPQFVHFLGFWAPKVTGVEDGLELIIRECLDVECLNKER